MDAYELQSAGFIKPGSAPLIISLIERGMPMAKALPRNMFTGRQGAQDLPTLSTNVYAQADAMAINLEKAQTELTNAGLITGKESPTAIAGVVKAAAKVGVATTLAVVKSFAGKGRAVKPNSKRKNTRNAAGSANNANGEVSTTNGRGTPTPTNVSSSAVQPTNNAVSGSINRNVTAALTGSTAQEASTNPLTTAAVQQGGGVIKIPNSSDLGGVPNIDLQNFFVNVLFMSPTEVETTLMALEDPETPLAISLPSASSLTNKALGAATSAATGAAGALQGKVNQALGAIGNGNMAAQMADGVTSGLGSLKDSLAGLSASKGLSSLKDQSKGLAATAFNAIKEGFPKMPAGVPVDVAQVAKEAAAKAEAAASSISGSVTNKLSGAGGLAGNLKNAASGLQNSLSGGAAALGKNLSGAAGAVSGLSGAASKLGGALSGGGAGVAGALAAATGGATSAVSKLTGSANQLVNSVSSTADQASKTLNAVTGVTPTNAVSSLGGIKDALSQTAAGAITGKLGSSAVSTLSSGLSNLPGGAGAAGALTNLSKSATGALGSLGNKLGGLSNPTSALKSTLGGATSKLGGLSKSLTGKLGSVKDLASSAINNLKPPKLDAAALLSKSGLPSGLAAQLESQISAISSGGGVPISMPVAALNTTNRGAITAAVDSLIGDPGIPKPNLLGEVQEATVSEYEAGKEKTKSKADEIIALGEDWQKTQKEFDKAYEKFSAAKGKLPAGDPQLETLRQEAAKIYIESDKKREAFLKASKEAGY